MRKSSNLPRKPTEAEKSAALARALKEIEEADAIPRPRSGRVTPQKALERESARSRFASDAEYEAWKAETTRKSRERMDAWIRNPPWFSFFDPYGSVLREGATEFVDARGKKLTFRSPGAARQLLYLAKSAADEYLAGNTLTKEDWIRAVAEWKRIVDDMRTDIATKHFQFRDPLGGEVSPNLEQLSPFEVLSIVHQLVQKNWEPGKGEEARKDGEVGVGVFHQLWCVICLSEIDSALLSTMYEDAGDGIGSSIRATEALSHARECLHIATKLIASPEPGPTDRDTLILPVRQEFARSGAKAKLARDPKQAAKREVKDWWIRWRSNPTWYQGKSSFARAMLDKFPVLSSQPVIESWCRRWEKEEASEESVPAPKS